MKYRLFFVALIACCALSEAGTTFYTNTSFVPPDSSGAFLNPLPAADTSEYLANLRDTHTFSEMSGQNAAMKANQPESGLLQVAQGYPAVMSSSELFSDPIDEGSYRVYIAAVRSVDAYALRLLVDLSGLRSDEQLWLLDPSAPRSFGPFTRANSLDAGRWLPTVLGDTAVLAIQVRQQGLPSFRLLAVSHFFRELEEAKELNCNINIACEESAQVQRISSGIGLVLIAQGLDIYTGSGALINTSATGDLKPYFMTSHHVVSEVAMALNTDIIWDFRSTSCTNNNAPQIAKLPHSATKAMLATTATLDATLLELDAAPSGAYGRAYLGWDTRVPKVDEEVILIHHPQAKHMRISYGRVQAVNQSVSSYQYETLVGWYDGLTEGGSSGGCLLLADGTYRIAGTLTGGSIQTCDFDPKENWDYFSSFTQFYKDISPAYLKGNAGPYVYEEPGEGEGEGESEGEGEGEPDCAGMSRGAWPRVFGDVLLLGIILLVLTWSKPRRFAKVRVKRGSKK